MQQSAPPTAIGPTHSQLRTSCVQLWSTPSSRQPSPPSPKTTYLRATMRLKIMSQTSGWRLRARRHLFIQLLSLFGDQRAKTTRRARQTLRRREKRRSRQASGHFYSCGNQECGTYARLWWDHTAKRGYLHRLGQEDRRIPPSKSTGKAPTHTQALRRMMGGCGQSVARVGAGGPYGTARACIMYLKVKIDPSWHFPPMMNTSFCR